MGWVAGLERRRPVIGPVRTLCLGAISAYGMDRLNQDSLIF
jgi:hypothetical protein